VREKRYVLLLLIGMVASACGSSSASSSSTASSSTKLTVLAAASLKNVFPQIGTLFTQEHPGVTFTFSFAGTDQLAAQIEQGAPADVFAGASTKYGDQLAEDNLTGAYKVFCTNRLVLITPASNPAGITSLEDLATKPVKLVIGSETVPVGSYTRTVLENLNDVYGTAYSEDVLANVVSNEDSVTSILTKVQSGEADGGFVYITDARSAGTDVSTISLPSHAQAVAKYPIAVVSAGKSPTQSQEFMDFVLSAPAQTLLEQAGFGTAPAS
jgi:molybdate transport system substrate-binding protein